MSFGHVLPSSSSRVHVSRGQRVTTASHRRRRSDHRITRPNRSFIAPTVPVDGGPELEQTETGRDGEKTET
ncbi:hypothetical protein YC2023_079861 [Brassica napus]